LYFYFSGLSLRRSPERPSDCFIKEIMFPSGTRYKKIILKKCPPWEKENLSEYVIDETVIKVGSEHILVWVATIEPESKEILIINISIERNTFVAERFISEVVN
jgi:putative transposase